MLSMFPDFKHFVTHFDPATGTIPGLPSTVHRLSDLQGSFADHAAYRRALEAEDRVVYLVTSIDTPRLEGGLSYALGMIIPGKIGQEYHLTKGHFHAWRPAAEVYIGLSGEGRMLLEGEGKGQVKILPLLPNTAVYVPGYTAHRTVNVGSEPLTYMGVFPAQAGHDYGSLTQQNFRHVIIERDGEPVVLERAEFLISILGEST